MFKNDLKHTLKNKHGFSLIEIIVVITIMAVLVVVLAPALLKHQHDSQEQKDDSSMDEVVAAIELALTDAAIYDELLMYCSYNNVSCYIDNSQEDDYWYNNIQYIKKTDDIETSYYTFDEQSRIKDEIEYYAAGNMRGVTITFHPDENGLVDLHDGIINQYIEDKGKIADVPNFYSRVRSTVGDTIKIDSVQYRHSAYTIFISMGSAASKDESSLNAVKAWGQWNGTNLPDAKVDFLVAGDRTINTEIRDETTFSKDTDVPIYTEGDLRGGGNVGGNAGGSESGGLTYNEEIKGADVNLTINPNTGTWGGKATKSYVTLQPFTEYKIANATKKRFLFAGWELERQGNSGFLGYRDDVDDTTFANGIHVGVYNNKGNGAVTHNRIATDNSIGNPTGSGYVLKIKVTGIAAPGNGGFVNNGQNSSANQHYLHVFKAKLPEGGRFTDHQNATGDGSTSTWITSKEGTGEWETYAYIRKCGSTGNFSTYGHVAVNGLTAPFEWYLAESTIYNITETRNVNRNTYIAGPAGSGESTIHAIWGMDVSNGAVAADASTLMVTGQTFNDRVYRKATEIIFTNKVAPAGVAITDLSVAEDGGVVSWNEGTVYYVSTQRKNKVIKFNPRSDCMFQNYEKITNIQFDNIDTSQVTHMNAMFNNCKALETVNVEEFVTPMVVDMSSMFRNCSALTAINVGGLDTSNVSNFASMFYYCNKVTELNVSGWNTQSATNMSLMFQNCSKVQELDVSDWLVNKVTTFDSTFAGCGTIKDLNISGWNTEKASTFRYMFSGCSGLTTLDVSNLNTSMAGGGAYEHMFNGCTKVTNLDVAHFKMSNQTSLQGTFQNCQSLTTINISDWDVSKVYNLSYTFNGCIGLTVLNLSEWNTDKLTTTRYAFQNCSKLVELDISGLSHTANPEYVHNMFAGCAGLQRLSISAGLKFNGSSGDSCTLPTPATGKWYNLSTGAEYLPNAIPVGVAATYVSSLSKYAQ